MEMKPNKGKYQEMLTRSSDPADHDTEIDSGGDDSKTNFLLNLSRKMSGKRGPPPSNLNDKNFVGLVAKRMSGQGRGRDSWPRKKRGSYEITADDLKLFAAGTGEVQIHVKDEENLKPEEIAVASDGGWGWMVVLGSFISNVIVDGLVFSIGILLVPINNSFEEETGVKQSDATMGWIISLLNGFYGIGGPLAATVANRYGFRVSATIGSLLASTGFALTYLFCRSKPNLMALYLCMGVLGGLGCSLLYVSSVLSVGFYFEKHRAMSTGICVCGAGVGQMIFGYVLFYMLGTYGWKNALLIQAGFLLSCSFSASLYRPLKPQLSRSQENSADPVQNQRTDSIELFIQLPPPEIGNSESESTVDGRRKSIWESRVGHTLMTVDQRTGKREIYNVTDMKSINSPLYRDDIFLKGTMRRIPIYAEVEKGALTQAEWSVISTNDGVTREGNGRCTALSLLLGGSILTSPAFLLILLASSLIGLGLFTPYAFLPDIAAGKNLGESSVQTLFITMGAANTVGRVVCGIVADLPQVNAVILLATALCVSGGACLILPFLFTIEFFIAYVIVFGLFTAFFFCLLSVVLADIIGLEHLTNAFGIIGMVLGSFTIVGTPFGGYLVQISVENLKTDEQHNFDLSFFVSGFTLVLAGVVLFPLRCVSNWEKKRKKKKQEKEDDAS